MIGGSVAVTREAYWFREKLPDHQWLASKVLVIC
jgi:hypothetical protein